MRVGIKTVNKVHLCNIRGLTRLVTCVLSAVTLWAELTKEPFGNHASEAEGAEVG